MKPILVITLFACSRPVPTPPAQRTPLPPRPALDLAAAIGKCTEDCTFAPACYEPSRGPRDEDRRGAGWDAAALVERCRTLIGRYALTSDVARSCGEQWHMGRLNCIAQTANGPHYASDFDRCVEPCLAAVPPR